MNESEKIYWRKMKADAAQWLREHLEDSIGRHREVFVETDARLAIYCRMVTDDPEGHNLYEILGVKRFLVMLDRYIWKPKKVKNFVKFYEQMKWSGTTGRSRYKLTPVQTFQFANIYGFYKEDGRRLIRTAYIFVPRKFSKTTGAASMALYDMLFGDFNAQACVAANTYKQAKICFDEMRKAMKDIDPRMKHFRINRELINFKDRAKDSLAQCLTSNADTQDGLFASLVIIDEYSQAKDTSTQGGADLKNVLVTSMGPRKNPLTVVITTASEVVDGPFYQELEGVKAVLRDEIENDSVFASIFEPDVDDYEGDPRTWKKVQPHMGITVQDDFYESQWGTAQLSAANMLAFKTKLLNIFTINEQKSWFTEEKAKEICCGTWDPEAVEGRPDCAVSYDLSVRDDFSAVSYTWYNRSDKRFYSFTDFYFPEGALKGHPNENLYRQWHEDGWLKFCEGNRIDIRMISEDIIRRSKYLRIIRIGYDSYKAQDLTAILKTVFGDFIVQPYGQTFGNFNLPVESFEWKAYGDPIGIEIYHNPIMVFCLVNSVIMEDKLENKKPMKISHFRKIDGAITTLMTIGMLATYER